MSKIAIALTLSLAFTASAQANVVDRALKVARAYWQTPVCGQGVSVSLDVEAPKPALPGTQVEAWVYFQTPSGPLRWEDDPQSYSECEIAINPAVWPSESAMQANWPSFCQVMIHEYGHFEGWADSTTAYAPTDIRYPLQSAANVPSVCIQKHRHTKLAHRH